MPKVPWDEVRANRIVVAHIYHRIDPDILSATLSQDVPRLAFQLERWRARELSQNKDAGRAPIKTEVSTSASD